MTLEVLYFTLWFMVTVWTIWDVRRNHTVMQQSLERIEQAARDISAFLGTGRR